MESRAASAAPFVGRVPGRATAVTRRCPAVSRLLAGVGIAGVLAGCAGGALGPNEVVTLAPPGPAGARLAVLTTVRGPAAAATTTAARASCPPGTVTSGGGMATTLVGGRMPPSSLHVDGGAPTGPAGAPPGDSGPTATGWEAVGATGGQLVVAGVTTALAMCLRGVAELGPATVVAADAAGPSRADTTTRATASCPPPRVLLGGGGLVRVLTGTVSPSLHLIGSFPSAANGSPAGEATGAPRSWSAVADAGGRTGAGVQTVAFAVCAAAPRARTDVVVARASGPLSAGSATTATASCPPSSALISGGVDAGPANGSPQQGLHLTGSFPSDGAGVPAWSSPAARAADAWTGRAEAGGQGSPSGTLTTAFAVCLRR